MIRRTLWLRIIAGVAMILALSACRIDISISTVIAADGSGVFSLAITADKEFRESRDEGEGLDPIEKLVEGAAKLGWTVSRSEPDGGLRVEVSQTFEDSESFDALLEELSSIETGDEDEELSGVDLALLFESAPGRFSRRTDFSGRLNTSDAAELGEPLLTELRRLVGFEVKATFPAGPVVSEGSADIVGSTVVWRPQLGENFQFAAYAVQRNQVWLIAGLITLGGLTLAATAFVLNRRRSKPELSQLTAIQDD